MRIWEFCRHTRKVDLNTIAWREREIEREINRQKERESKNMVTHLKYGKNMVNRFENVEKNCVQLLAAKFP